MLGLLVINKFSLCHKLKQDTIQIFLRILNNKKNKKIYKLIAQNDIILASERYPEKNLKLPSTTIWILLIPGKNSCSRLETILEPIRAVSIFDTVLEPWYRYRIYTVLTLFLLVGKCF